MVFSYDVFGEAKIWLIKREHLYTDITDNALSVTAEQLSPLFGAH